MARWALQKPQQLTLLTALMLILILALQYQSAFASRGIVVDSYPEDYLESHPNSSSLDGSAFGGSPEDETAPRLSGESAGMTTFFLAGVLTKSMSRLLSKEQLLWVHAL